MAASSFTKPTIVWVPGLLHTPAHYQPMISSLAKVSIPSLAISLPNIGPGAATAAPYDDVKAVRVKLHELVAEGKEVIVLSHSYGGVPACQAIRGLERSKRVEGGQLGGVIRIIFLAAFAMPEGMSSLEYAGGQLPPPWAKKDGDIWRPNISECISLFFSDLPAASQKTWAAELQPASHNHCTTPVGRACWDIDVPKTYIVTTKDAALPEKWQDAFIESVKDDTWTVKHIASDHAPFLSHIDELVEILVRLD